MRNLENIMPVIAVAAFSVVSGCGGGQKVSDASCPDGSHFNSGVIELKPFLRAMEGCLNDRFGNIEDLRSQCGTEVLEVTNGMWRCAPKRERMEFAFGEMRGDNPSLPNLQGGPFVFSEVGNIEMTDMEAVSAVIDCVRKNGDRGKSLDSEEGVDYWHIDYSKIEKRRRGGKNVLNVGTSRLKIVRFNLHGGIIAQFEDGTSRVGADGRFDLVLDLLRKDGKCAVSSELIDDDSSWKLLRRKGNCGWQRNPEGLQLLMQRKYGDVLRKIVRSSVCRGK